MFLAVDRYPKIFLTTRLRVELHPTPYGSRATNEGACCGARRVTLSGIFHVAKPEGTLQGKEGAGYGARRTILSGISMSSKPRIFSIWAEGLAAMTPLTCFCLGQTTASLSRPALLKQQSTARECRIFRANIPRAAGVTELKCTDP